MRKPWGAVLPSLGDLGGRLGQLEFRGERCLEHMLTGCHGGRMSWKSTGVAFLSVSCILKLTFSEFCLLFTFRKNQFLKILFLVNHLFCLFYSPCHWFLSLLFLFTLVSLFSTLSLYPVYQIECFICMESFFS